MTVVALSTIQLNLASGLVPERAASYDGGHNRTELNSYSGTPGKTARRADPGRDRKTDGPLRNRNLPPPERLARQLVLERSESRLCRFERLLLRGDDLRPQVGRGRLVLDMRADVGPDLRLARAGVLFGLTQLVEEVVALSP